MNIEHFSLVCLYKNMKLWPLGIAPNYAIQVIINLTVKIQILRAMPSLRLF